MSKQTYIVTGDGGTFSHDGRVYQIGEEVELEDAQATQHLKNRAIAPPGAKVAKPAVEAAMAREQKAKDEHKAALDSVNSAQPAGASADDPADNKPHQVREASAPGPRTDTYAAEADQKEVRPAAAKKAGKK